MGPYLDLRKLGARPTLQQYLAYNKAYNKVDPYTFCIRLVLEVSRYIKTNTHKYQADKYQDIQADQVSSGPSIKRTADTT